MLKDVEAGGKELESDPDGSAESETSRQPNTARTSESETQSVIKGVSKRAV